MLMRRNGHRWWRNGQLIAWPQWAQAWREDYWQRAVARAQAKAHAPTRPGERLLAVGCGTGGELSAATDRALYYQTGQSWARLGWEQVSRVDWDDQRHLLILAGLTPAVPARTMLGLAKDWGLPAAAIERVGWVHVLDQRISLNGGAGARVVARRVPGEARIAWLAILDHGLDPASSQVRAELMSALTDLRAVTALEEGAGSEPGSAWPWLSPGPDRLNRHTSAPPWWCGLWRGSMPGIAT